MHCKHKNKGNDERAGSMEGALIQAKAKKLRNNYNNKEESSLACSRCKKKNHSRQKCYWRPDVKCKKCYNLGHME